MQKITPFLWFDNNAEEAINFYTSIFKDSKVGSLVRLPSGDPKVPGKVMTATFRLFDQDFIVLNGGPQFRFTEAISFVINCHTQEEVDHYWNHLTADGGAAGQCGWLKDQFGLSWQVVPVQLPQMLQDKDPQRSQAVMQAMMQMKKLDITQLQKAYDSAEAVQLS